MAPEVVLISQPSIDFGLFLGACHKMLGRNLANSVDQSRLEKSDSERFLACLLAFENENTQFVLQSHVIDHASFSVLMAADERDLLDILKYCQGMAFTYSETLVRGVLAAVVTGTLRQWHDAVKRGTNPSAQYNVRACFCKIMATFQRAALGGLWADCQVKSMGDNTFCLEDKRRP